MKHARSEDCKLRMIAWRGLGYPCSNSCERLRASVRCLFELEDDAKVSEPSTKVRMISVKKALYNTAGSFDKLKQAEGNSTYRL